MDIVSTYKQSTNKFSVVEKIAAETGMKPKDIFLELLNAHAIDGRMFRQGRYKDDWTAAKREYKNGNINSAKEATTSFEALKKENAELKKFLESAEVPESYQKTIDAQQTEIQSLNETIETHQIEIQSLNEVIEDQQKSYQEAYQQMKDENDSANALIEDLRTVIQLREDEVKELTERIELFESDDSRITDDLKAALEKKEASVQHLLEENSDLKKQLEHHKVSDFNATTDSMVLESRLKTAEEKNAKLLERIRGLEEENEELRCTNCADDIKRQLAETTQNYNDAMLINRKLEEQIKFLEEEKESDGIIIVDQAAKVCTLEKKLRKAEEFVLNRVLYEVKS